MIFNKQIIWILWLVLLSAILSCQEETVLEVGSFSQVLPSLGSKNVPAKTTFEWTSAPAADAYTLQVSTKNDFGAITFEINGLKENTYTLSTALAPGFVYYWRIKASNKKGEILALNAGISFRTIAEAIQPSPTISVYYVSPTGEDNPGKGSLSDPFKTLAYAATQVPAGEGDTIQLMEGTFLETEPSVIPLQVNVIGAGEDKTILSSSGVALPKDIDSKAGDYKLWYDGTLIQLISPHRVLFRSLNSAILEPANGSQTISGFSIDGNNKTLKAGVWVENRNNVTMHHVTFKNLAQRGAVFAPGNKSWYSYPEFYMKGIKISECTFINSGKDLADETLGNLNIAQLDGAEISNINIRDTEGYGIKFIYDGYFKNTKIHDCSILLSESDSKWGEDIAIEVWNVGPGNEIYNVNSNTWLSIVNHSEIFGSPTGTANMKVHDVRIIDKDGASLKESIEVAAPGVEVYSSYFENKGIGIAIWDMGRSNITVRNNVFYNTNEKINWAEGAAIYIDNSRSWDFRNIRIFNNVFDTHRKAIKITGSKISDIAIRNNAFLNTTLADIDASGFNIVSSHNIKYKIDGTPWIVTGVTSLDSNLIGLPGFRNTGERYDSYYKPNSASSFVVDKGVDVGLTFKGNAPDIGYSEY